MGRKRKSGCLFTCLKLGAAAVLLGIIALVVLIGLFGKDGIEKDIKAREEIPFREISLAEEEVTGRYYYQQLEEEERTAYKEIVQGLKDNVADIYVHEQDADRTNDLFQYVLKDFPEIFWCEGTTKTTSYSGGESYTVLQPVYSYSGEDKEKKKSEIEAAVNACLSQIPVDAPDYDKILYVYEYIVNTVDYDMEASDNQNIYSVFVNHRSVCAGYSKATQYLLERLGVFCTYVTGTTQGQSHAWNLVQCEGDYYYVDSTWGDPVFKAAEGEDAEQKEHISYDYMCCDDEELFKTHQPDSKIPLPECTKMDYNYYVVNGMYYTEYDSDSILKAMNDVIAAGTNPVVFKFADSTLYNQAHEEIFQDLVKRAAKNLADWYGLKEVKYQYMDEENLNKITIYWQYE